MNRLWPSGMGGILSANRLMLLGTIPLFLVMAMAAYLSVRFAIDERIGQSWIVHTYQAIEKLESVQSDVLYAESGQRGFIITRQDRFLAPYHGAMAQAREDLARFQQLTHDNPRQQARASRLKELFEARFHALDFVLAHTAPANVLGTPTLVDEPAVLAIDRGKGLMDSLHAELERGIEEERSLLASRIRTRRNAERNEIIAAGAASLVALIVLLIATLLLMRSNQRLGRSEKKLENESAILQTTLDNIRDGIAMFASDGELCVFNQNFVRFLDFPLARKGMTIDEFRTVERGRATPVFAEDVARDAEGGQRASVNGRELEIYKAEVPTGGFVLVCMDATARLQAEQAARQAQKMEAIGHLTGGVAHDFNNLLQIIGANLERTAQDVSGNPKAVERLQNAIGAVGRGARLTGQLLAFARRQALDPRSTNIGRVIQEMTDLLRRTLGEPVEVECVIAGGLWNTLIDPNQVENAILNLAINARDAMEGSGKLTIEVANAFLDDAYAAQHTEVTAGQYVMVAVSDTGSGMSPEVVARVFEPFFTTKPEGRGTGLGLSQVYGFVKQSGGHIKIYSELGQGTTVKLYLPRTRRPQEGPDPVVTGPSEGGSDQILVVEDDDGVRAAVVDMLGDLGYRVLKAENAEQALAILGSGAHVDLLFTDVVMPGPISTRELARRGQQLQPGMLVLYTSGYTQNAIVHNGKLDEGLSLLSKPYRKDELARKLRSLLDGKRKPMPENVPMSAPPPLPETAAKKKVLVVEDVALIRMTTVDMVEEIGMIALEAGDGAEALAILQNDPDIDILLTDLGLPGMTGRQLMAEALRLNPGLKVVVASGYATEKDAGGMPETARQLMKPFTLQQLREALTA